MLDRTIFKKLPCVLAVALVIGTSIFAQTSVFTYQGKMIDGGALAAGSYQMTFKLFDAVSGGTQIGSTISDVPVTANAGMFSADIDFGVNVFTGANRYIEIAVRHNSGETYTILSPRQPITSAPYSIRALISGEADIAADSQKLGGIAAANFLVTNGDGSNLTNVAKLNGNNVFTSDGNSFPKITLAGDGQIIAPRLENAAVDPAPSSSANTGRAYFNTSSKAMRISNGTQWQELAPRMIYSTSGTGWTPISCNNVLSTAPLYTLGFTKNSASSRLRIEYSDLADIRVPASESGFPWVEVLIDDAAINPTTIRMQFTDFDRLASGTNPEYGKNFTIFGFANGIAAGAHTLTVRFFFPSLGSGSGRTCSRGYFGSGRVDPYEIEVEEVP